jgi:hypothetical protein
MSDQKTSATTLQNEIQQSIFGKSVNNHITFFWKLVLKKWLLFFISTLILGIGGMIYASFQPVKYESKLLFALDEGGTGNGGSSLFSLASQFGFNMGGGNDVFGGDNIMTIIKSRRMIEKALLSVDSSAKNPRTLISLYLESNGSKTKQKIQFFANQPRNEFSREQDSLLYRTYEDFESDLIKISKPDKYLNLFEVEVLSTNEKFTKLFTETLVDQTNNYYKEIRSKKGLETLEILEQRVREMKDNLNTSITSKAIVQDANVNGAFSQAQVPVQKSQANIQTYGTAYAEMFKNLEIARYQYLKQIPLMQIIDNASYPMHKIKTSKIISGIVFVFIGNALLLLFFWISAAKRKED